ncbi:MAG: homoserine kinase [Deltaproteobacteria bacterium]|nr:homoserine kinase [Deltaproteobacteria bacterium]
MNCTVRVPATTSNLGPGFDCFGMALSLHLEVEARFADRLSITAEGAEVALDKTNLIVKTFLDNLPPGSDEPPLALHMRNRIPLARGLGSSAAARVAGLTLADAWHNRTLDVDRERIAAIACALEGHPDNATPAIFGGFCISAGGAGFERVEMTSRPYLLIVPEIEIHTEAARGALPKHVPLGDAVFNLQRAALAVARICRHGDLGKAAPFHDRLHQAHRLALDSRLKQAFEALEGVPSIEACFLSGSGPTVFVIPKDFGTAPAAAQLVFEQAGLAVQTFTVWPENRGTELIPLR